MFQLFSAAPFWVTLIDAAGDKPAVRVQVRPIDRDMRADAYAAVRDLDEADRELMAGRVFSDTLLRKAIVEWEGIGDADGKPVPVTSETVELFLRDPVLFPLADRKIVDPALTGEREKNVSSRSPTGTSAGATAVKPTARTARSAAKTARTKSTR